MTKPAIEDLLAAANAVTDQAAANPGLSFPVDPDVADYMGAVDDGELPSEVLDQLEAIHGQNE